MKRASSFIPWLLTLGLVALTVFLARRGYEFYRLDVIDRVEHPDYRTLSPSGFVGHGYGIAGTGLMLTNLLYLVRRRFPKLPVGSMQLWLHIHVFSGLSGSILVLFHSAFQLRTPLATATSASVVLAVVTGLIGRYLVSFGPRADVETMAEDLDTMDRLAPGSREAVAIALAGHTISEPMQTLGLIGALARVPGWRREARERRLLALEEAKKYFVRLPKGPESAAYRSAAFRVAKQASRQASAVAARTLLASWRGLHRFFAFLLILTVSVHIGVAWHYGFRWIFSE